MYAAQYGSPYSSSPAVATGSTTYAGALTGTSQYAGSSASTYVSPSYSGGQCTQSYTVAAGGQSYAGGISSQSYSGAMAAQSYSSGQAYSGATGVQSYPGAAATSYTANSGFAAASPYSGTTSFPMQTTQVGMQTTQVGHNAGLSYGASSAFGAGAHLGIAGNSGGPCASSYSTGLGGGVSLGFADGSNIGGSALQNMPKFVFGAGGPPLDFTPTQEVCPYSAACPYSVGQAVDVYSDSQTAWLEARVSAVSADGTVTVKYGNATKAIDKVHWNGYLRPASTNPQAAPVASAPAARRYQVGDAVDVFSNGEGKWVPAKVTAVAPDGTVSIKWGARNQKDIAPQWFEEYLRPSAPTGWERKQPSYADGTIPSNSAGPYSYGETVEVYSRSEGGWVQARVQDVQPDGTVTAKWGPHMKKIQPNDYEGFLRHMPATPEMQKSPSMGASNFPSAQLPPTLPGNGPIGSGFDVVPTIPGGYQHHGGAAVPTESSPTRGFSSAASLPGAGPTESTPTRLAVDAQFVGEVPPTNLGGEVPPTNPSLYNGGDIPPTNFGGSAVPPTNFGAAPVPAANLRYHEVATIPGGYY